MITKTLNEQFKKEGDDYFLIWPGGGGGLLPASYGNVDICT